MKDKFLITICCQGQPFYKKAGTLEEAVECFKTEYLEKNKYGTMNFTLEVGTYTANKIWNEVKVDDLRRSKRVFQEAEGMQR